jgi:nucleotide-binding universal stress UspA family protein
VRGHVAQEVLAAASQVDLVTLGKQGRSRSPGTRLGSTALRLAAGAPSALLLVEHGVPAGQPVLVVFDGAEGTQRALDAAAHLAKAGGTHLIVLLPAEAPDAARELEHQAAHLIKGWDVRSHFRSLPRVDVQSLTRTLQSEGSGLVVLSARSALLPEETLQKLLDHLRNPVLLVR